MANLFPLASEEPSRWYVLNAIFGKELQTCQLLRQEEIECFVPMRYEMRRVKQKPVRVLVPAVHNLVFVHATKAYLEDFKSRVPFTLYFMTRKEGMRRTLLTVPDGEMSAFIRVARMVEEDIHYFRPEEIHLEKGIRVSGGTVIIRIYRQYKEPGNRGEHRRSRYAHSVNGESHILQAVCQ